MGNPECIQLQVIVEVDIRKWAEEYCLVALDEVYDDAESYLRGLVQECSAGQAGLVTVQS